MLNKTRLLTLAALVSTSVSANIDYDQQTLREMMNGHDFSGTPWVFEESDDIRNFTFLRDERRDQYVEYFVYMSLKAEKACHNTLGLITIDTESNTLLSVDMVHHAPSKRCLTYTEFKNP